MSSIFMRFPDGKKKALTLSYDDGVEQDIKLISIMKEYDLKGTFHLNSGCYAKEGTVYAEDNVHRRLTQLQAYKLYNTSGMEIAAHGYSHAFLDQLPTNLCTMEIVKDREQLENQYKQIIRGISYACGAHNEEVVECLKIAGIAYARTVLDSGDFSLPKDWFRLKPTCHHNNIKLMELAHKFVEEEPVRSSWLFYLWGHSYEFERDNNWEVIQNFAQYIGRQDNVWYATNIEIYEYIKAYNNLIFSMDGMIVHNPTATKLYFQKEQILYAINPGMTEFL